MARPDRTHIVRRLLSLVHSEAHDPGLCLKRVSQLTECSECGLSRWLVQATGRGFREHLRNRRVALAKDLLADTTLSLKEIAAQAGFGSASQLTRQFSRTVGVTPSGYRKSLRLERAS